jgi:iron-sulfur cluster assembly protein
MIHVTDNAVNHLRSLLAEQGELAPDSGLRIFIEHGGCSGLQYAMNFDAAHSGDEVTERDGVRVIVDAASSVHLRGATIDYCDDLTGTGFRIQNPNARRTCGCGTSFEPENAEAAAAVK